MYRKLALLICAALSLSTASAQTESSKQKELFHNYSKLLSPEKVYLHTDKDVYFATDTIWFSGYVENASYASEFDESNYIYVELISDELNRDFTSWSNHSVLEKTVVSRKKLKIVNNCFQGHIAVPEMSSTGRAVLRAYTYWMLNRPAEYMFYKELELTNPMKDKLVTAMEKKKVKNRREYARVGVQSPFIKDKENEDIRYDVQFMPESGNYIQGEHSVLYVKAVGKKGAGVQVFGDIKDENDNIIGHYSTDSLGFGKVKLTALPEGKLTATVKDSLGYEGKNVKLPKVMDKGITINGNFDIKARDAYTEGDKIIFTISVSGNLQYNGLTIYMHNGSEVYFSKSLQGEKESIALGLQQLTSGIHSVSVVDSDGNVYAERPFIVLPATKESLELETQKEEYSTRELVDVKIKLPKEMIGEGSNFSVAVTDMGIVENCEKTTMQSYMLLKSEIKGYIENIDWYFNDSIPLSVRMHKADMLMQTQGWRYYDTEKIFQGKNEVPNFGREYRQTLFGKVVNPVGLTKKATVSFLAPSINFKAMGQIDSGYFVLKDVDFPENTRFIVSAVGKNGRSTSHMPVLRDDYYAPDYIYPIKPEKVKYSPIYSKVVESIYYNGEDGDHAMAFELNPVVVTSQLITPKNSPSPIPNYPINKSWYRDTSDMKPYVKHYDLETFLRDNFYGLRVQMGGVRPLLVARAITTHTVKRAAGPPTALVQIYVNGMSMDPAEFSDFYLYNLKLSDIESLIFVQGLSAAPFQQYVGGLFPSPVLMIRTKPYREKDVPYNVTSANPLGWQKPAKFYSPKYDTPESKKSKVDDNRITLYWNPAVKLDENGEATISFYTSDSDSQYRIEVEGRSSSRQYHYVEKIIERKVEPAGVKRK